MYTPTLKEKTFERAARRIKVVVTLNDGTSSFDETFYFAAKTDENDMKRAVKSYVDELNGAASKVEALTNLNYEEPVATTPDPAEVAFQAWSEDLTRLAAIKAAESLGLDIGVTAPQVNALRNKIERGMEKNDQRYIQALAGYAKVL